MSLEPLHTDEEIVALAITQKEFFGVLVERYEEKLTRYIRRLGVRSSEDIEDVLQEVFLKAYRYLNDFDTTLSFSSWIYRIAHNEAISFYRKLHVRPEGHLIDDGDEALSLVDSGERSNEFEFDISLNSVEVKNALSKLEQKYRDVVVLRYFEHKEYEEISDILKIPTGSVGTLIHRAKKRMKTLLDPALLHL